MMFGRLVGLGSVRFGWAKARPQCVEALRGFHALSEGFIPTPDSRRPTPTFGWAKARPQYVEALRGFHALS